MNKQIKKAYMETVDEWTGAMWTHEYCRDDDDNPVFCDGDQPECSYCRQVEIDAALAADYGLQAYRAAEMGDWLMALDYAGEAINIESSYGLAPTYQPLFNAIKLAFCNSAQ